LQVCQAFKQGETMKETIWLDKKQYIAILESFDSQLSALKETLRLLHKVEIFTAKSEVNDEMD
jgi:hypothetical protein